MSKSGNDQSLIITHRFRCPSKSRCRILKFIHVRSLSLFVRPCPRTDKEEPTRTVVDNPYPAAINVRLQSLLRRLSGFSAPFRSPLSGRNIVNGLKNANNLFVLARRPGKGLAARSTSKSWSSFLYLNLECCIWCSSKDSGTANQTNKAYRRCTAEVA